MRKPFEVILVLGDSHAKVFSVGELQDAFPDYKFDLVQVGGATVSGLKNPLSKTQAIGTFMEMAERSLAKKIVVLLGEVDVGFVIWHRAAKYQADVSQMLADALRSYQDFLDWLTDHGELICISAPLPTKKNGRMGGFRAEAPTSQHARTSLTTQFNGAMEGFCDKKQFKYINLDKESMGDDGLIDQSLVNKQANDHHYCPQTYARLLIPKLKQCLTPTTS